jgi:histidyl-tRNA synthetase
VLCVNFGEEEALQALRVTAQLRAAGIRADIYPSNAKMQKQMKYANNRSVPNVILIGQQELKDKTFVVKNMANGEQKTYALNQVDTFIKEL